MVVFEKKEINVWKFLQLINPDQVKAVLFKLVVN